MSVAASFANYRRPGVFVLPVRVFRAAAAVDLTETPAYAGCKTWVELDRAISTEGATPVLEERAFAAVLEEIDLRLNPAAFA